MITAAQFAYANEVPVSQVQMVQTTDTAQPTTTGSTTATPTVDPASPSLPEGTISVPLSNPANDQPANPGQPPTPLGLSNRPDPNAVQGVTTATMPPRLPEPVGGEVLQAPVIVPPATPPAQQAYIVHDGEVIQTPDH